MAERSASAGRCGERPSPHPRGRLSRFPHLRTPRQAPPNIEKQRAALMQRAEAWKADLRAEPKVARLLLRRLVGPLTLWDATEKSAEWIS